MKVAKVDRTKLNKEQTVYMPLIPDIAKCPVHLMPLKEWEDAFLADFSELRLVLYARPLPLLYSDFVPPVKLYFCFNV